MSAPFKIRYTKKELENLRTQSKVNLQEANGLGAPGIETKNIYDNYLTRLVALVPTEILGIYLILREAIVAKNMNATVDYWWVSVICLGLVLISRLMNTIVKEEGSSFFERVDWWSVIVPAVSFIIWVLNLEGSLPGLGFLCDQECSDGYQVDNIIIMSTVIVWTFIVPYFLKPQTINPK